MASVRSEALALDCGVKAMGFTAHALQAAMNTGGKTTRTRSLGLIRRRAIVYSEVVMSVTAATRRFW
jgi:hypothetical protein